VDQDKNGNACDLLIDGLQQKTKGKYRKGLKPRGLDQHAFSAASFPTQMEATDSNSNRASRRGPPATARP
jgi:hypothetical protein